MPHTNKLSALGLQHRRGLGSSGVPDSSHLYVQCQWLGAVMILVVCSQAQLDVIPAWNGDSPFSLYLRQNNPSLGAPAYSSHDFHRFHAIGQSHADRFAKMVF